MCFFLLSFFFEHDQNTISTLNIFVGYKLYLVKVHLFVFSRVNIKLQPLFF